MVKEVVTIAFEGKTVGAVSYDETTKLGQFEYDPKFVQSGIELSPIKMPLAERKVYQFPNLPQETFKGLPGLLADALPDDFGNAVLNAWVAQQGRNAASITPLQRLQYTGKRGMGALEFAPATQIKSLGESQSVAIESLVSIAQDLLDQRTSFSVELADAGKENKEGMRALLSVGMSAGGARPKAVLAFNHDFSIAKSGQTNAPVGFTHYLMKFDGVSEHRADKETFGDPLGFGAMEYVYYKLATLCQIDMMPSHLLQEGDRRHFITQRFDRVGNQKRHVQTLNGMAHVDYKNPGSYSYEEIFGVMRQLGMLAPEAEQMFRRMVFNIVARNHDDHSKNFAFIYDNDAHHWGLAPAYDIAYSYQPGSKWVNSHWMSLNMKRDDFERADFYGLQKISPLFSKSWIDRIIDETVSHVSSWSSMARAELVPDSLIDMIEPNLLLKL